MHAGTIVDMTSEPHREGSKGSLGAGHIGQGTLRTRTGRPLPLEKTRVRAEIGGLIAAVTVEQRFANDTDEAIEAVYLFPLPGDASVHRMEFRIADRVVRAVVKEKGEAKRVYERARREGRAATLLEEEAPSLFTLSVANVPPRAAIDVVLGYEEVVHYDDGEHRFAFPMVAPERYRTMAASEPATLTTAKASARLAPPRLPTGERSGDVELVVDLHVDERALERLRCPTHPVDVSPLAGGGARVCLDRSDAIANRDFVLRYGAADRGVRPSIRFSRQKGATGTVLVSITPPAEGAIPKSRAGGGAGELKALACGNCGGLVTDLSSAKEIPGVGMVLPCGYCGAMLAPSTEGPVARASRPRDVVVLVDRSASMRGAMPQARRCVRELLDALDTRDAVQVLAFDHDRVAFDGDGNGWAALSDDVKAGVDAFLDALSPRGGTELFEAIERAAKLPIRKSRTSSVVLVTDAAVGNEGRLVRRALEVLGTDRRLFVLGLGAAVDARLAERLARATGGASDVLGLSEDVEPVMARFTRRVRASGPILVDLTVAIDGVDEIYPRHVTDLFGGQPITLLGRFDRTGPTKLVLTGSTADGRPYHQEIELSLPELSADTPALDRLWAKRKIEALIERLDAEPYSGADLRAEAIELGLSYALVTRFTSLVAEDSEVVGDGDPDRVDVETMTPGAEIREEGVRKGAPPQTRAAPPPAPHAYHDAKVPDELYSLGGAFGAPDGSGPRAVPGGPPPPPVAMALAPMSPPRPRTPVRSSPEPMASRSRGAPTGFFGKAGAAIRDVLSGSAGGDAEAADSAPYTIRSGGAQAVIREPDGSDGYDPEELRWLATRPSG